MKNRLVSLKESELEELTRDAVRYRYIRSPLARFRVQHMAGGALFTIHDAEELDSEIDTVLERINLKREG